MVRSRATIIPTTTISNTAAAHEYGARTKVRRAEGASRRDSTRRRRPGGGSTCIMSRTALSIARSSAVSCWPAQEDSLFIRVSKRREFFLQHAPGFRNAPLDGAERRPEHLADLLVRVFAGAREQERVAEFLGQRADEPRDIALQLVVYDPFFL